NAHGANNRLTGPNQPNTWSITGVDSGKLDQQNNFTPLAFNGIQNLTGGSGSDDFVFQKSGSLSGTVDGGGGSNSLDYSALTTGVMVDLPLGQATGTLGVKNIQKVTGGSGTNILVGAGNNVVLQGGAGRSILIGGAGTATLVGGSGDALLI